MTLLVSGRTIFRHFHFCPNIVRTATACAFVYLNITVHPVFKVFIIRRYFFNFYFIFTVRLLSVLRGHSFFPSPPQRPMTSDFEGFSIPDCIHYIYFPIFF